MVKGIPFVAFVLLAALLANGALADYKHHCPVTVDAVTVTSRGSFQRCEALVSSVTAVASTTTRSEPER
jgi:hypothetical protein